jgi:V-type H+-transporting ATPase subunit H
MRRILVALLQQSQDPTVLAVAAHDVGQYIKHYDLGKK